MDRYVILVTGASSGIGKACAELLCGKGHIVYGTSRHADGTKIKESENGGSITMLKLDVTDDDSAENCVNEVLNREGRIDVLVNNAGFGIAGAIEDTTTKEMLSQLDTNLLGIHRMCRLVLPHMRERKFGKIINIGSVAGFISIPYQAFYSVSKFGVEAYSRALRSEVSEFGIKVCVVQPGDTKTGFTNQRITVNSANNAYADKLNSSVGKMAHDEQNGVAPVNVAKVVLRAINKKNLPVSITVGLPYKLIKFAVKILPDRLVEFVVGKMYA